ncbi:MAG TPA: SpoIIE family protein phosphatase, partial [Acidimicrobiia bacterium]|nr:SpoIIE family protein phosphatase [Acidimicrobiia bacterium]
DSVPFGQSNIQLVMSPRRELGGMLLARLAWLIAVVGVVVALAATLMTERLVRRRLYAETLARDNARLFSEQRSVARMLQHSLLPEQLPEFTGLDIAVRYVPGVHGVEIGGDWYDVIEIDETHIMFVVGDVSGRGLRAATVMASLRYAIRAYAVQGDDPASILLKLTNLISVGRDGHFATVLCALVDIVGREMTVANAGHPLPLLIADHEAQYLHTEVGPPVGVSHGPYVASHATVPRGATVLAFTDGLFERRGENPDVGLSRLRAAAIGYQSLDALLDGLLNTMTPSGTHDDTAILGIRWRT